MSTLFPVSPDLPAREPRRPRQSAAAHPPRLCVLGSGSGGNCTVLRDREHALLVDAGFGPRTTGKRLTQAGLDLDHIRGICLTHLDQDHFRPSWPKTLLERQIPLYLHHWHLPDLHRLPRGPDLFDAGLVEVFDGQPFCPLPGWRASAFRCQHDLQGTIAYRLDGPRTSIGYATDLGHVPPALVNHLAGVDLLAIEANYDQHMTIHSSRPTFVNRRNMSDSGHLSNEQSLDAVQRIAAASPHGNPRQVLLLHRSSQCNHPTKLQRCFARQPHLARRITLTHQRRRTRWLHLRPLKNTQRHQLTFCF